MKTIIHINQHNIRFNNKQLKSDNPEELKPVITTKNYKENNYSNSVQLVDKETGKETIKLTYSPDKPLNCGARVWLEFDDKELEIISD